MSPYLKAKGDGSPVIEKKNRIKFYQFLSCNSNIILKIFQVHFDFVHRYLLHVSVHHVHVVPDRGIGSPELELQWL